MLLVLLFVSCGGKKEIPELLEGGYSSHLINFDEAKPEIDLDVDNLQDILVLLHHRITPGEIKNHFQLTDKIWNERINYLFGQGLIKKYGDSSFVPTVLVLDEENGKTLKILTDSLGNELSGIAIDRLNKIKEAYHRISSLKNIPFDNTSLLILGGFVHDFDQLKVYQEQFIKALVPTRGNTNYYMCLLQNRKKEENPKLYKTIYYDYTSFQLGSFASTFYERNTATYSTSDLIDSFGKPETESDDQYQITILNELINLNKNSNYNPNEKIFNGFIKNGIVVNGKPTVPYFTKEDFKQVKELYASSSQDIINYFENRQTLFVKWFLNSPYREETSYKEWMFWVYKLITAKTIDVLVQKSYIKTFGGNTASFIIEK